MFWRNKRKKQLAKCLAAHLNAREYEAVLSLLSDDFTYSDAVGSRIDGAEDFITAVRLLHFHAPDETIHFNEFARDGDVLLIKGEIVSRQPGFSSPSLWKVAFTENRVSAVEAFRENNAVSIPALYHRSQLQAQRAGAA